MADLRPHIDTRACWEDPDGDAGLPPFRAAARTAAAGRLGAEERRRLVRAVEAQIVPQLIVAGRAAVILPPQPALDEGAVAGFADLVVAADDAAVALHVDRLRAQGMSVEAIYLDLLTPAARRLGVLWETDARSFSEVTLGLWRMHHLLRSLSSAFYGESERRGGSGLQALLVATSRAQHTFGVMMVAEFFRRAGWGVSSGPFATAREMLDLVHAEWFSVVGFSVACDGDLDAVASEIRTVRRVSRNRAIGVMVGGRVFVEHPELVAGVGADATATDGRLAVLRARDLADTKAQQRD